MNILITGIHGFVGTNIVQSLQRPGYTFYGLDIVAPEKEGVKHTYSWKDLEEHALPEMDVIIHLAGKAHDTKNQSEASVYFEINTKLTEKVYRYFLSSQAKRFVFFSSVKAAADQVHGAVLTEDVKPSPRGPYGESKIAAEDYILQHLPSDDKRVYILRPCMIHGPGNKGNLNLLYSVVSKGIPWPLGAFENRRSFTSIDNLSFVIEGLMEKDVATGIYNMGDDEALSTNELIRLICEVMGRNAHIWNIPQGVIRLKARFFDFIHLSLFNSERLRKLTENYVVSNAKIKQALGIASMPVSARDGFIKTLKSFKE